MVPLERTWTELEELTSQIRTIADDIGVVLVANTKAGSEANAGERVSEYLSDNEAAQLITGLRQAGFSTRYVEGERCLIAEMLKNAGLAGPPGRTIVYNIAQSGTDAGRKSLVPSFCALMGVPVCNSGSYAVSLARNKMHVSAILQRFGLPVPSIWAYSAATEGWLRGEEPPVDVMLIAKACHESSSVGLDAGSVGLMTEDYLQRLHDRSRLLAQPMVVQPLIPGYEFEVPLVEIRGSWRALGPAVVTMGGDDMLGDRILDYDTVAHDSYGYCLPLAQHQAAAARALDIAPAVAEVLGLSGFARVDFRVDPGGKPQVTDVSTSPHLVWHGAFSHVFQAAGWSHSAMMAAMIAVNAARVGWI